MLHVRQNGGASSPPDKPDMMWKVLASLWGQYTETWEHVSEVLPIVESHYLDDGGPYE